MKRIKVIAYPSELSSKELVKHAKVVSGNISTVSAFTSLNVFITQLQSSINALDAANTAQKSGDKSTTSAVKEATAELKRILRKLAADVEFISADNETVALSSGFGVKKQPVKSARSFKAVQGEVSGTVNLELNSFGRAAYQWEMSEESAGVFNFVSVTLQSKTTITGLTPGTKYWFRVAVITAKAKLEYTDPYMVHVV